MCIYIYTYGPHGFVWKWDTTMKEPLFWTEKLMVNHAKFGVPYFQTTQYHQLIVSYISWSSAKYRDCFGPRSTLEISLLGKSFDVPQPQTHPTMKTARLVALKNPWDSRSSPTPNAAASRVRNGCLFVFFCCAMPIDIWQICIKMVIKYHSTTMYQLILYIYYIIIYNASFIVSIFRATMSDSYELGDTRAPAQSQQSFAWFTFMWKLQKASSNPFRGNFYGKMSGS